MVFIAELMVLAVPAAHPKSDFAAECGWMAHRLEDFEISRANAGIDLERVALLDSPIGHVTISYLEGTRSYRDVAKTIRTTPSIFDQDMMTRGKVLHGMSEEQQRELRAPLETAVGYRNVETPRGPWHSFVAPVAADATGRWQRFCDTLAGPRTEEFEAFLVRNGYSAFREGLYRHPRGQLACVYIEGSEDVGSLPRAVRADGPFEEWFATEFSAIHGADLRQKLMWPLVGKTWDWVKGEKNENVAPLFTLATRLLGE
jgi:hypothetical protein